MMSSDFGSNPHNATFDYARLIAAFGIVVFHAQAPGAQLGYAGLPFFLILLLVFAGPASDRMAFRAFARNRAFRLLMPWVVWSTLYGLLKIADAVTSDEPLSSEFSWWMLFTGPALHLWFLPFAWVISLAVWPSDRLGDRVSAVWVIVGLAVLTILSLALWQLSPWPPPLGQWIFILPSVFVGLAFAMLAMATGPPNPDAVFQTAAKRAIFVSGCIAFSVLAGWTSGTLQLGLAGAAFILCSLVYLPSSALSRTSSAAALGVYLVHPIILSAVERLTAVPRHTFGFALLGCVGALIATLVYLWAKSFILGRPAMRRSR